MFYVRAVVILYVCKTLCNATFPEARSLYLVLFNGTFVLHLFVRYVLFCFEMKVSGDKNAFGDMGLGVQNYTHFTAPAHRAPPHIQIALTF